MRKHIPAMLKVVWGITLNLIAFTTLFGCGSPAPTEPVPEVIIPPPPPVSFGEVTVAIPVGMVSTFDYTWVASWDGGTAPYTLSWDFGGGSESIQPEDAVSPATAQVMLGGAGGVDYSFTVVVKDAMGLESQLAGIYTVSLPPEPLPDDPGDDEPVNPGDDGGDDDPVLPNTAPTIMLIEEVDGTISVSVNDIDNAVVTVDASSIPGMVTDSKPTLIAVPGTAIFRFEADENHFFNSGTTTITVEDESGAIATETVEINLPVPDEFIFTAEYDRKHKVLTLNRDFSHTEWVNLQFAGSDWMSVSGGNEQVLAGGWSSMAFDVDLAEDIENTGSLVIQAFAQATPGVAIPVSPVYEATVQVTRPVYITSIDYDSATEMLSVDIDAVEDVQLEFTSTFTNGIQGTGLELDAEFPNHYSALVDFSAADILYGYASVTINDQDSNTDTERAWLLHESAGIDDDALYAYYDRDQASVGEAILITVVTGRLSHPFSAMTGVGLVMDEDVAYVHKSFNVGSPGGERDDPDGIWPDVQPNGFMLAPDRLMYFEGANPEDSLGTSKRHDYNVSPFARIIVEGGIGDLFNIQVSYSEPGIKTLAFQECNGVYRTYYGDMHSYIDRFWGDITNSHPGLQTSIVVQ